MHKMLRVFSNKGFQTLSFLEALRRHKNRRNFDLFVILFEIGITILQVCVLFYTTLLKPIKLAEFHNALGENCKTEEFPGALKKITKSDH
jgi:hypothetical protein